jgi:uncharacterized protein (UPF0333 family)
MKKQPKTKGFSTIEGLLILVIVLILGGVGWYVWHSTKSTNDVLNSVDKSSSAVGNTATQKSVPTSKQTTQTLDIKEWKVKLPLSTQIADAYYVVSTSSQDDNGQPNTVWLGLKSLDNVSSCAASSANKGGTPLAGLGKVLSTETDPVSGTPYQERHPNGTTLDGYYYNYVDYITNRPCTTQADLQQKLKDANNAFADAAKKITKE